MLCDYEKRINDLRFGIALLIEKTKYDEYGTFEDVRNRIIELAQEIIREDNIAAATMRRNQTGVKGS